jgi:flagellar M-ring protein FliF
MSDYFKNIGKHQKSTMIGIFVVIAITMITLVIWLLVPKYTPLFKGLDDETAASVIAMLEEQKEQYQIIQSEVGSSILVNDNAVQKLKVSIATKLDLPSIQGLELFENSDYSMTDFTQEVTYKRAIQGELTRTISSMSGIKSARVHITFAPKRLFSQDNQKAKSSVYIEQHDDVTILIQQVEAIKKLVANSVENLLVENVIVFDRDGNEFTDQSSEVLGQLSNDKYSAKLLIEKNLSDKVQHLLGLILPPNKFAISIDVLLNFDQKKTIFQGYSDTDDAMISRKKESSIKANDSDLKANEATLKKESEIEFVHNQEKAETIFSTGEIKSLSIGVFITSKITSIEVDKIEKVLAAAVGINKSRGDKIEVETLDFSNDIVSTDYTRDHPVVLTKRFEDKITRDLTPENIPTKQEPSVLINNSTLYNYWPLLVVSLLIIAVILIRRNVLLIKHKKEYEEKLLIDVKKWLTEQDGLYEKI